MFVITCPFPDSASAKHTARALLKKHLSACVQMLAPVQSFYVWEGKEVEATEFILLIKCTPENADAATEFIEKNHPYEVPCILRTEAVVNAAYYTWMLKASAP